ncbi:MAG: ABC transporter substrate-binding protein [Acidimicrobiaceae bacterium]|nr:ABC transporter substrate-binding protein [Acidimicrobiaceae bacterium]
MTFARCVVAFFLLIAVSCSANEPPQATITIESWRLDDQSVWDDEIIPAFEAEYPHIDVVFTPTTPLEYPTVLRSRLESGEAGDLITCFAFDRSRELFEDGYLAPLDDLPGIDNFGDSAQAGWISADGSTPYCVPVASVIQGFFYNVEVFEALGLRVPETEEELFKLLQAIADNGTYVPIGMGLSEWEAEHILFQNIGTNYWKGEEGRLALIDGDTKVTDQEYVDTFETLARFGPYMHPEASGISYSDGKVLFETGQAAIYPAGSWEISGFDANAEFEFSAFRTPLRQGQNTCYIVDHNDLAIGLNPASPNAAAARTFLTWVTSPDFASVYTGALPGFFSQQNTAVPHDHRVAAEFVSWREDCESANRNGYEALDSGDPEFPIELRDVSNAVILGEMTPQEAARRLQDGLDSWYTP